MALYAKITKHIVFCYFLRLFYVLNIPLLCVFVLTFIIYSPGLSGGYISDDYPNIVSNEKLIIKDLSTRDISEAAFSGLSGPTKRPVSMLSFAVNIYLTGLNPFYFKLTNLLLHIINGFLIYIFISKLLEVFVNKNIISFSDISIKNCSLLITSIWLLHPINLTSVLYIVQRMNLLASLFTILGLIIYIQARNNLLNIKNKKYYQLLIVLLCLFTAALCKENGIILILYMLLFEAILFNFKAANGSATIVLHGYYLSLILISTVLILIVYWNNPGILIDGYSNRDFTPYQRLITEARVIWIYINMIIIPSISKYALFHDDIIISSSIFEPVITLLAIIAITTAVIVLYRYRAKLPLISFGLLFFLVGHSVESTILPLEIAYEHRNYLPSIGIIIPIVIMLYTKEGSLRFIMLKKAFAALAIIALAVTTYIRAQQWSDPSAMMFYELKHKPNSARANYEIGKFYATLLDKESIGNKEDLYGKAHYYFNQSIKLNSNNIETIVAIIILNSSNKKDIEANIKELLLNKLTNSSIDSTAMASIASLLNCKKNKECEVEENLINNIIKAISVNKHIFGREKSILFVNVARYYLSEGDIDNAYDAVLTAIQSDDDNREAVIIKNSIDNVNANQ